MIQEGKKYLVTADAWFYGSDGQQYRAAYGICRTITMTEAFGFTPQRPSSNWFLQVGEGENSVIIAGCQIHYAVRLDKKPYQITETFSNEHGILRNVNDIFFTE